MVCDAFVLSDMFSFGVLCHMVRDGDANVLMDAVCDGVGLYPVRYMNISEQGRGCCV